MVNSTLRNKFHNNRNETSPFGENELKYIYSAKLRFGRLDRSVLTSFNEVRNLVGGDTLDQQSHGIT